MMCLLISILNDFLSNFISLTLDIPASRLCKPKGKCPLIQYTIFASCQYPIVMSYEHGNAMFLLLPSLFTACSLQLVSISRRRLVGILTLFFGSQLRLSLFCLFIFVLLLIPVYVCFIIYIFLCLLYRWR